MSKNKKKLTEIQLQVRAAAVALFGLPIVAMGIYALSRGIYTITDNDIFAPVVKSALSLVGGY